MQDTTDHDSTNARASPCSDAAARVLTNATLLKLTTSFQGGLSKDLYDFVRRCYPDWSALSASDRRHRLRLLGVEVIRRGDVALLELAARVQYHEPVGRQLVARRIPLPIQHTIENNRQDMLHWIYTHGGDPHARPTDMWNDAIAHFRGDFLILEEIKSLLHSSSEPISEIVEIQPCMAFRLVNIDLLRWICANVPDAKIPAVRVMAEAVDTGNFDVVQLLHEIYPEPIFRSDMYYRALTSGGTEVLEFLLKHRPEPYNDRFVEHIVGSGNIQTLELVLRHRGLRLEPRLLELARIRCGDATTWFQVDRGEVDSKTHVLNAHP